MRKLIAGLLITFFMILSIPIFSVSVFPIMQRPSGFSFATLSSSLVLERVETATGAELFNMVYSPSTGGHKLVSILISQLESVAEAKTGYLRVSRVIASGGIQYLHPKQGYSCGSSCPDHSFTFSSRFFASESFSSGNDAFRFSRVPLIHPHFLHRDSFIPRRISEWTFLKVEFIRVLCMILLQNINLQE